MPYFLFYEELNMLNSTKYVYIKPVVLFVLLCGMSSSFANQPVSNGGSHMINAKSKIQDTKMAVQYFEEELNFKTNPHGVKAAIDGNVTKVTIVDVRSAKDFAAGHIPGAINVPYDQYNGFEGNDTTFPGLRKDGYNYVYCYQLLCNLGQKAAKKFASLDYPVKEIVGGFQSWKDAGYPIE